ncbi:hypothetical protein [Amycolatopsis sp. Hca4]|uniref:hypothetical protein n=1 Tax=Amycolatopsis sp. Hca4 TaxID=2742131 RepID=UPI00159156F2|nr:hypothetical protein [Amycolatopsis sp. Hca4]QKV74554.1 hypothetical protein HUT10_12810 [Amycolatopsis sp. Hca4]
MSVVDRAYNAIKGRTRLRWNGSACEIQLGCTDSPWRPLTDTLVQILTAKVGIPLRHDDARSVYRRLWGDIMTAVSASGRINPETGNDETPRVVVVAGGFESAASNRDANTHSSSSQAVSVLRPRDGRVQVTMPYSAGNRSWIREICGSRTRPVWNKAERRWEIARAHFRFIAEALADRFGACDVYLDIATRTVCTAACRDARGEECDCSCEGRNHRGLDFMLQWIDLGSVLIGVDVKRVHRRVVRGGGA